LTGDSQCYTQLIPQLKYPDKSTYITRTAASPAGTAVAIFEEARALGFPSKSRVIPITTADHPAKRPAYSVLDCVKISAVLETHAPHSHTHLANAGKT